jgi:hypothetical protein
MVVGGQERAAVPDAKELLDRYEVKFHAVGISQHDKIEI